MAGPSSGLVEAATLGAILHDIGKLWAQVPGREPSAVHWDCDGSGPFQSCTRCARRFRYAHAPLGARMAEQLLGPSAGVVELVAHHHAEGRELEPLISFVKAGDGLSADERSERGDTPGTPFLVSPLAAPGERARLEPRALGDDWPPISPASPSSDSGAAYERLVEIWKSAGSEGRLTRLRGDALVDACLGLVENVGSLAPSAFYYVNPDISLAAHLHLAGAIAGALAAAGSADSDPVGLLVVGDLSGIQSFIHRVPSQRAAKQLRARSFYLSLLSLVVARTIARDTGVTPANVLSVSGGNFQVLAPAGSESVVDATVRSVRRAVAEIHRGAIDVVVAVTPLNRNDLRCFSRATARAREELAIAKLRRFDALFAEALPFEPYGQGGAGRACQACGADEAVVRDEEIALCELCHSFVELGASLPRKRYVSLEAGPGAAPGGGWQRLFRKLGWEVELLEEVPTERRPTASLLALEADALRAEPTSRLFVVGKYVPTGQDGPLDFEELANQAEGQPVLACAKVDIDSLGEYFRSFSQESTAETAGDPGGEPLPSDRDTPSRYASASRFISLFFEGYVDWLAESDPYRERLYLVFSGGDDALVIGAWDAVLDFLLQLRQEFTRWTMGNPALHFSAGVAFGEKSRPVVLAMREAEEALAVAKAQPGKDRCTLFGIPFRWADVERVRELASSLTKAIRAGAARGLLQDALAAQDAIDVSAPLEAPVYGPALWRVPHRVRRSAQQAAPRLADVLEQELLKPGGPARVATAARLSAWQTSLRPSTSAHSETGTEVSR